jgi:uncharacterized protein
MNKRIIGVISDTHGLFRPEIINIFKDCDLILHAGDIGKPAVITELERVAPVLGVRGNIDRSDLNHDFPITRCVELGNIMLYLIHNLNDLDLDPKVLGFSAIISGHSHKPAERWVENVLYLNPGSAGPKRFDLPVSVAVLKIDGETITVQHIDLMKISQGTAL